jgi:hypothetical protein
VAGPAAPLADQLFPPAAAAGQAAEAAAGEDLSALTVPKLRALCKQQRLPHTGNKPELLVRLGNPEQLRGLNNEDSAAAKVSPVKVDSRAEECPCCGGVVALDHQCGAAFMGLQVEELREEEVSGEVPGDEPYVLEVNCSKEGRHKPDAGPPWWCCELVMPSMDPKLPVPAPPRVFHPYYNAIGYLLPEQSDLNSSCYLFTIDGRESCEECFAH